MKFDIITIFPEMFGNVFSVGVLKKALDRNLIEIRVHDLRDFASDNHKQVDDRPFGGKPGMVLKPEPIFSAVENIRESETTPVYLLSPQGRKLNSSLAEELAANRQLVFICGRYEGVDERVVEYLVTDEISIGDYVLTGGEPAAVVLVDAISRFIPDVVGKTESVQSDSFIEGTLGFPQYTRPRDFRGKKVPDVLFTGDHKKIEDWRKKRSLEKTRLKRPDLLDQKDKMITRK